jgi:hypothetical protein
VARDRPTDVAEPLPPPWKAAIDRTSGQMYYYNDRLGTSMFDDPRIAPHSGGA